jgi:hypothetical protein
MEPDYTQPSADVLKPLPSPDDREILADVEAFEAESDEIETDLEETDAV